jgi:hypothetical protein
VSDLTIRVLGAQRLATTLRKAGVDVADMKDANERVGKIVADAARGYAPRRTGRLQRSIKPSRRQAKVIVRTGAFRYAWVQNYGSAKRNIRAKHYMENALAARQGDAIDQYYREVNDILGRVKGS